MMSVGVQKKKETVPAPLAFFLNKSENEMCSLFFQLNFFFLDTNNCEKNNNK